MSFTSAAALVNALSQVGESHKDWSKSKISSSHPFKNLIHLSQQDYKVAIFTSMCSFGLGLFFLLFQKFFLHV